MQKNLTLASKTHGPFFHRFGNRRCMYVRAYAHARSRVCVWRYGVCEKEDCVARLDIINDTFFGRIIFITTNSWLCTLAHILRVADKGRCYAAKPWRINLLIKAIPLTPTGATTHLIRHWASNSSRPCGPSTFCNHRHRSLWYLKISRWELCLSSARKVQGQPVATSLRNVSIIICPVIY